MKKTFFIPNISCRHCIMTITRELQNLDGVTSVEEDVSSKHVEVTWDKPATKSQILDTLDEIGYPAENA
ncbi:MAG: heavy-metal-associated domain-containing protein [Candidatus Marinimicrobia bacterium]|nr:heavy-metal-associated domain-containing protein [Candidatus Neomarinimicrobiota bacterium]